MMEKELIVKTPEELAACKKAQKDYCKENKEPHFAPENGICWKCNRNIYQNYDRGNVITDGVTLESASKHLITDCPHCHRSYCD